MIHPKPVALVTGSATGVGRACVWQLADRGTGSSIAYCASKGGLNTMTKSFARSLAPKVRVNAILPGPIDSR